MTAKPRSFVLQPGQWERCLQQLQRTYDTRAQAFDETIHYHDTYDWRLYGRGTSLVVTTGGPARRSGPVTLIWQSLVGVPRRRWRLDQAPAFAWDLPRGPARDEIEATVGVRRLLPRVAVRRRGSLVRILDSEGKIVLRIRYLERRVVGGGHLHDQLLIEPLKGYRGRAREIEQQLQVELGVESERPCELDEALRSIGGVAQDYSSKISLALQPEASTESAMRAVHTALLAVIRANRAGVIDDVDSEFLHDFRVAVRRTRSVLGQIKGAYPRAAVERFGKGFSWLGTVTGPQRDLDVFLLKVRRYGDELAPADRQHLAPLEALLLDLRAAKHGRVVRALSSRRYERFLQAWADYLRQPISPHHTRPKSNRPVLEVASRRTWKVYRRVLARGEAIGADSCDSDLHRLRIEAKKLRYLMELFRSLYPKEIDGQIRALKGLQDLLGDINDSSVQEAAMQELDSRLGGTVAPPTHIVIGRLIERFHTRREELRAGFLEAFAQFAAAHNRATCRELFRIRSRGVA